MNTERFYDLTFEQLPDGTVRIQQRDGGEDCIVDVHPAQLLHIARTLRGNASRWPAGFERKLKRIHLMTAELVDWIGAVPCFPPRESPSEKEMCAQALLDTLEDFLVDFGFIQEETPDAANEGAQQ